MVVVLRVLAAITVSTVFTLALVLIARATHKHHRVRGTTDIEPAYITTVGTLYGIFLAFMIFTAWNQYNDARNAVDREANAVADVYRLAAGLPQPLRGNIRQTCQNYARSAVNDEWVAMTEGKSSRRTERTTIEMWALLTDSAAYTQNDILLRDHMLTAWTDAMDLRRLRLLWSSTGLTEYAYALLLIGALITIGLACLFTVDDLLTHVLKAGSLAAVIAMMLVAIWGLDHPFSRSVRIDPTPFTRALRLFTTTQQ